jgi:hypothetical protein
MQEQQENQYASPFNEVAEMDQTKAINILIQAAGAAQASGGLSLKDAVLVTAAIEFFTLPKE